MPATVRVVGTEQFHDLARRLKEAGDKGLRREVGKSLRQGVDPLVKEAQGNVLSLPIQGQRGGASGRQERAQHRLRRSKRRSDRIKTRAHQGSGLRATVARSVSGKVTTGASSASLRVRAAQAQMPASQRKLPRHLNTGRWRHPVFGRSPWVTQTAEPGWFDRAMDEVGPDVRDKSLAIIANYIHQLE